MSFDTSALLSSMPNDALFYFSLILIIATLLAYFVKIIKQPLLLAYILTGIILGQILLSSGTIDTLKLLSEIGISFLLFLVGIELSFKEMKYVGKASLVTGIGQILFTFLIGFFILKLLNFTNIQSLYISIALTFSSTIIIVKLLTEKQDLQSLYGRISIGFLLVQDFFAILILVVLAALQQQNSATSIIFLTILRVILLFLFVYLFSKYILPRLFDKIAKSQELLFLSAITLPFLFILITRYLGFSIEIGAFLAGLSLANLPYKTEITNKIRPLRDFFITLFFVVLGMQFVFKFTDFVLPVIILSLFVLIGNPLIVMILMGLLGYKKRTGFFAGLTVAQISEFSLIIALLGLRLGHLNEEIVSLITLVGIITITASVYMIIYNNKLYKLISPYLNIFEKKNTLEKEFEFKEKLKNHVVVFGCHRLGRNIVEMLTVLRKKVIVVDFDPIVINELNKEKINCLYGDIGDIEIYEKINLKECEFIISTVPDKEDNLILLKKIKELNKKVKVILTAQHRHEALELYKEGADYVIMPYTLSSEKVADMLRVAIRDKKVIEEIKKRHLFNLEE